MPARKYQPFVAPKPTLVDRIVMFFVGGACGGLTVAVVIFASDFSANPIFLRVCAVFVLGSAVAGALFLDRIAEFFTQIWNGF